MASSKDDEGVDDYDGLEYNIISRPQEIINEQKRVSTSKILIESADDKPNFFGIKRISEKKHSTKSQETDRKGSSRHERKSSKEKSSFKLPFGEAPSNKKFTELAKQKETLKKLIQRELGEQSKSKQKFESLKVKKEERSSPIPKNNEVSQDKDKNIEIPVSKIMKEPAITPMQRFQALNARDTALRAHLLKSEGSKKRKVLGTCPDMCPEKERYGRIAKNCVSILEMVSTFDSNASSHNVDHSFMIKEYSRSSADQQEPLAHELRPVSVLNLTMDYLICNIIDKCPESISLEDWYDFIWNRTRSIRKDITQQELCDPTCVAIIEKCVRFHIHCAEALSEEDSATFDPKINNENLNKCLQTLKHMYQDLLSKGIESPNEAEFRAYDILLSLTEGETLRIIKDIRKDLHKSTLIKSAFEVALAFKSNNYVNFFKIIQKANYLSSCILHRYLIKVRSNALQVIVRAYSTQHNTSMYPLSRLVNDLKFENENEAADFCRCHGLEINEEFIIIDRKQFSKSPSGLPLSRSFLLVGHKKGINLGLIINNGGLPANPKLVYQPHNSFDDDNMLKIDCLGAVTEEVEVNLTVDKQLEQEDEEMETEDVLQLPADSSHDSKLAKDSKSDILLQDSHIDDLEKRRAELLRELDKAEFHNFEKQKQREEQLKQKEKKKSSKKSHSPSKSHKSVMFSKEKSDFLITKRSKLEPNKDMTDRPEFFSKPIAINSASFNKLPPHTNSSSLKYDNLGSSNVFAPVCTLNSTEQLIFSKVSTTTSSISATPTVASSIFGQSSLPNSAVPLFSFQKPQSGFGFTFKSTPPESFSNSAFVTKTEDEKHQQSELGIVQTFGFPSKKIVDDDVKQAVSQKMTISQQLTPTIIIGDSKIPDEEIVEESEVCKFNAEKSIPLSVEKIHQLEQKETTSKLEEAEILEVITSESPEKEIKKSDIKIIKESDKSSFVEERQKQELINKFVDKLADEMLFEVLKCLTHSICEEVLEEEKRIKSELDIEVAAIKNQLAKNVIFRWRIFVQKKREKRIHEKLAFYSPWQSILLNIPRVSSGAISPFVAYKKHCSLTKTSAEILKKRFENPPGWEKINAEKVWPLDCFKPHYSYADTSYFGTSRIKNFFKLCIFFPHVKDPNMTMFMKWICEKFSLEQTESSKFDYRKVFRLHMGETVVVIRAVELTQDVAVKHSSILEGVTAVMLFLPKHSKDHEIFLRNLTTLQNSSILDYPCPLYIYFMGQQNIPTDTTSYLDLSFYPINMQCISNINNFVENSETVLNGLKWFNELKDRTCPLPILKKVNFRHYVEDALSYVFSIVLCKVSLAEYKFLLEDPHFIIDFYNRVMKFRAMILCSDFINGINSCWPPEEIKDLLDKKFIDMPTQNLCKMALENLLLPDFEGDPCKNNAWEYARRVPSSSSNIVLSIKISDCSIDWVQKMIYCAEHLIQNSDFILKKGDLPVFYVCEDLLEFDCDSYWLNVLTEMLPHSNSSKRKSSLIESCSPLKRLKITQVSTPKIAFQIPFENAPKDIYSSEETAKFSNCFDVTDPNLFKRTPETAELDKENDSLQKAEFSSPEKPLKAIGSERKSSTLFHNSLSNLNFKKGASSEDANWIDIGILKPRENPWSSLADRISELQYNLQKNSVLEDHFYELLNKQL